MIANSWDNVASRDHRPAKIFAFSKDSLDVMVDGTTVYNWQDGSSKTGVWACRVAFKEVEGALKISDYHVVFVSGLKDKSSGGILTGIFSTEATRCVLLDQVEYLGV